MIDAIKLFANILKRFHDDEKWNGATLGKIKILSNSNVGKAGQLFMEKLCDSLGISCSFPTTPEGERLSQSPWDIEIGGIKFELKTATEDTNGKYQFNHIRYHRPYDAVLCLGVSPEELHFGVWSKGDIVTGKAGNLVTMEKGANASYKLTKAPNQLNNINRFGSIIKKFIKDNI